MPTTPLQDYFSRKARQTKIMRKGHSHKEFHSAFLFVKIYQPESAKVEAARVSQFHIL